MALTSMAMTPEEAKQEYGPIDSKADDDLPKYPYGLTINLDDETMAKLGITTPPSFGTKMQLVAIVEVCNVSQYENQDGKEASMSLQITDMDLSQEAPRQDAATMLYGGDK